MRILVTLSYYLPNISGLTNYVKNLSYGLSDRNHSVVILSSRFNDGLLKKEIDGKVVIKRVWTPIKIGRGAIMPTYFVDAFENIKKADVVNIHLPQFEGFITAIITKLMSKRLIVTYHCDLSFWGGLLNILSTMLVYLSNFISCVLADKIVTNTKDYAETSKFLKLFSGKLVYIYPPVKIGKPKRGILNKYKNTKYKIGYVGRISKEKGVNYLLASIKYLKDKLPDFKIFLVGPVDEVIGGSQKKYVNDLLAKYKNNIVLLGKLSEEELFGFYREIGCLALPSVERQESFGMVQVEAMLSGCPVVACNLPGVNIPIKLTNAGLLIDPMDTRQLTSAIKQILLESVYTNNTSKASTMFNYQRSVSLYLEVFSKTVL